jgi:hypothetical protein
VPPAGRSVPPTAAGADVTRGGRSTSGDRLRRGRGRDAADETSSTWPTWAILLLIALAGVGVTCGGVGLVHLVSNDPQVARAPEVAQPVSVPSGQPSPVLPEPQFETETPSGPTSTRPSRDGASPTAATVVVGQSCPKKGVRARTATGERVRCDRARDRRLKWRLD